MKINRTIERTVEMLELISKNPKGLSLNEITEAMGIPKTSAFDILHSLSNLKMIELVDSRSKIYSIGVRSFIIGNSYIKNADLINISKPFLEELGNKLNKTIFIGKLDSNKVIYLFKHQPEKAIITPCNIGTENELYCTSLGKTLLAFAEDYKERINDFKLIKRTTRTITDKSKLLKDIEKVRMQKYAIDDRENDEHMFCIGAPIFNHDGKIEAAISATGLFIEGKDYSDEIEAVKEVATAISRKIGYLG